MSSGLTAESIGMMAQCGSTLILPCKRGPMMVRAMAGKKDELHMLNQIDLTKEANFGNITARNLIANTGVPTPEITIDGIGLSACHLIKIDVEGAELDVLEGASETIKKHAPLIQVECHDGDANESRIQSLLREHGYETYWLYARLFRPNNYKGSTVAQVGQDRNILAVQPKHVGVAEGLERCSL